VPCCRGFPFHEREITLLVTAGIASIIGADLKKNEAPRNCIIKFGPFRFETFKSLGPYRCI
jgi:cytochrome c biogenesis protein ResB